MKPNTSFQRKIVYGGLIAGLLVPLYIISRPTVRRDGRRVEGGILSRMRMENDLSQADLGEIDPTSETMKLATLGMKGIAANLLWGKANRYKRDHDWDNLTATLNQIKRLQPNFISVWQFQGWNLAYNVSVEFDDYNSRYFWVKRGINFLREGTQYNPEEPVLFWEVGWTFGHKIGKADEYVQYRRLFADDDDFHAEIQSDIRLDNTLGPNSKPDNWLVGSEYFDRSEQIVENVGSIRGQLVGDNDELKRGKTPLIFYSHKPKWKISFAEAIEEDGYLDEQAQVAWLKAGKAWDTYGDLDIPTTYGFSILLNDGMPPGDIPLSDSQKKAEEIREELFALMPGAKPKIVAARENLPPESRDALLTPWQERTDAQRRLLQRKRLRLSFDEIAEHAPEGDEANVTRLVAAGQEAQAAADAEYELARLAPARRRAELTRRQLYQLLPDVKEQIVAEKSKQVSPEMLEAYHTDWHERTYEQAALAFAADRRLRVEFDDILAKAPESKRVEVSRLVRKGKRQQGLADAIDSYCEQVNFPYWMLRCQIEQTETAIKARKAVYDAGEAYKAANIVKMRADYEAAWDEWAKIFDQYPMMMEDATAEMLMESVEQYRWVLNQMDEPFPPPGFKLKRLLELNDPNYNPNADPSVPE